ncbi:hypothetical protein [Prochlorococcus sp. MIT 1307]|uniref:hypothetical protein n=1 Tax=Prochlorococcus sp. MIT 1307 TaxID=3096219 RepID=UPI002A75AFBC|nr:hypothetical protein [Prochlorococcus sp. MIT 1307]
MGIILFFEALILILNIIIPSPKRFKTSLDNQNNKKQLFLSEKSDAELRAVLKNVDAISTLNKAQLTNLILSNQKALENLKLEERKKYLTGMTNQEIRSLLKGVTGVSRLRKSELVEMVMNQDRIKKSNVQ